MMPILGYYCISTISDIIASFASIIGFVLLLAIGLNMIRESLTSDEDEISDEFSFKEVTLLAIATSIDAFAVGITFALFNEPLWISASIIGVVAFNLYFTPERRVLKAIKDTYNQDYIAESFLFEEKTGAMSISQHSDF